MQVGEMSSGGDLGTRPPGRGVLALVAGPSGAGKDTLIAGAREALAGDGRFHFAQRIITRTADASAVEQHLAVSPQAFRAEAAAGGFLLAWHAHGTDYGIPASVRLQLDCGHIVVANVSRSVVAAAQGVGFPVALILVTAPASLLADRLASRGREGATEIASRLQRPAPPPVEGVNVIEIANDGTPAQGIARLVSVLKGLSEDH